MNATPAKPDKPNIAIVSYRFAGQLLVIRLACGCDVVWRSDVSLIPWATGYAHSCPRVCRGEFH